MGSFVWPVSTAAIITSPFGPRWGSFHYGTDLSYGGCNGDIIKAARAGPPSFYNRARGFDRPLSL